MTPELLIEKMDVLGMTHSDLAADTGRGLPTVWRWVNGMSPVPEYVDTILRLRAELHLTKCKLSQLHSFTNSR